MALSDLRIRKAKPIDRDYKLADEKGLHLLIRPNGSKLWHHRYRYHGKEKVLSYGAYPEVGLAEARELRDANRKLLRSGVDPSLEKKRAAIAAKISSGYAFEAIARDWHSMQKGRWTAVHAENVITSLENNVFADIGRMPIGEIDAPLVLEVLRKIERRGSIETAKRVRQRMSAVFVYAIGLGIAATDPAAIVQKALKPKPKVKRQPAVTSLEELRLLLDKAERSGAYPLTLLASRLLALTAVRPGVLRGVPWSEIINVDWGSSDPAPDALWHIPAERMKLLLDRKAEKAHDHLVPLAPAAVEVLRAARRLSGNCALIFPGLRHAHRPLSENAIGYLYNRVGWHGRHVPHGWRAAFSTIMNERATKLGRTGDRAVIDLMLSHVPENKVEAAYNRAQFMERRREIAEDWAELLLEGMQPADNLIELARRTAA